MKIILRKIDQHNFRDSNQCGGAFIVDSQLVLDIENGKLCYSIIPVIPHEKQYPPVEVDVNAYINAPDKVIYFAYVDGDLAGQIRVLKWWNAYAYIDDIAVASKHRRKGIGRALIAKAVDWAKARGFPGMMLETQNNNAAACRLYESCGFVLRGFDEYLYKGLHPMTDEIALYWYLIF
jgi:ribosomal protein S18 acetylase RimI-like enzyme